MNGAGASALQFMRCMYPKAAVNEVQHACGEELVTVSKSWIYVYEMNA